ncbi:hypothetical protein EVA_06549 [gut metagenome]|uniref:Uncharacterized protein n=1 Tax=gut metagenome TaxID=749906 RepID=J9GDC3_9ZZZZ
MSLAFTTFCHVASHMPSSFSGGYPGKDMSFMRFRYPIRQISAPPKIRHNKTFHLQTDILTLCPTKKKRQGVETVSYSQGSLSG